MLELNLPKRGRLSAALIRDYSNLSGAVTRARYAAVLKEREGKRHRPNSPTRPHFYAKPRDFPRQSVGQRF